MRGLAAAVFGAFLAILGVKNAAASGGPVVAIHDSEFTRALESMPAANPGTPTDAGTTGFEWWPTNWHYFVMPEALKEALRSDGTAFEVVSDADISAGRLFNNGQPRYPIVISLASEAVSDDEIAQLTNYVAAGGTLLAGSSAFTRQTNGAARGDFALASAMGLHSASTNLQNWTTNTTFTKTTPHRLTSHIPSGTLTWRMPTAAEEISWGISPAHALTAGSAVWRVQASDATVIAQGNGQPYLAVKQYGNGTFIYHAAMQPLIGHGGNAPGMYAYVIFRKAIEAAFSALKNPVVRVSPWPYPYDAAFAVRHDFEDYQNMIRAIEPSAQFEATIGAKGDYYFCTGTLRAEMTNVAATVASLQRAVTNYGATIGPHNGGLQNPNNTNLVLASYDYWHWGPDEALDTTPDGYLNGKAYALASVSNSFADVEGWLTGLTNGLRPARIRTTFRSNSASKRRATKS
jgi:ketosteroid isomerase-like protein